LQREEAPGAPDAGLDLITDEQRLRAAAQRLGAEQVARGGKGDALALHPLHHECGDIAARELALQGVVVPEWDAIAARQQWTEAFPELRVSVQRQRAQRQPVEGMLGVEHAR